jgi:hypothetical protein
MLCIFMLLYDVALHINSNRLVGELYVPDWGRRFKLFLSQPTSAHPAWPFCYPHPSSGQQLQATISQTSRSDARERGP